MGFYRERLDLAMLSVDQVIKLLDAETISAEEAEQLRDAGRAMAEILYEKWVQDHRRISDGSTPNKE